MRNRYWHERCERWGAWVVQGARGPTVAPWARLRNGTPMSNDDEPTVPELHVEERETDAFIALLPADQQAFLRACYPWQARLPHRLGMRRQTVDERLRVIHGALARMLDQRRRGEQIDPQHRRPRRRSQVVQLDGVRRASVQTSAD